MVHSGVAAACKEIHVNLDKSFELTNRWNSVAVVTDGACVLGLGNIGPEAAMPVMAGKVMLFKYLGGVDAFPICLKSTHSHCVQLSLFEFGNSLALFMSLVAIISTSKPHRFLTIIAPASTGALTTTLATSTTQFWI